MLLRWVWLLPFVVVATAAPALRQIDGVDATLLEAEMLPTNHSYCMLLATSETHPSGGRTLSKVSAFDDMTCMQHV